MSSNTKQKPQSDGKTLVYRKITDLTMEHIIAKLEALPYRPKITQEDDDTIRFQLEHIETERVGKSKTPEYQLRARVHGTIQGWAAGEQTLVEVYADNLSKAVWLENLGSGLRFILTIVLIAPCFAPMYLLEPKEFDALTCCYFPLLYGWGIAVLGVLSPHPMKIFPRPLHGSKKQIVESIERIIEEGEAELGV